MWKKIVIDGQETNYSVSTEGEVRNDKFNRLLKGTVKTNEYHVVQLSINKKPRGFMVHRLVAEAFCDNPNHYSVVDHIDHNKFNNNYQNLRWVTSQGNAINSNRPKTHQTRRYFQDEFDDNWKVVFGDNKYMVSKSGEVVNRIQRNYMVPQDRHGYKRINLQSGTKSLHIIVWESFNKQKVPEGYQIDHKDGNKANNCLDNLCLVSPSENMRNAYCNNHQNQKQVFQYDQNGNFIKEFKTIQEACDSVGVTHAAVRTAIERQGLCKGSYWLLKDMKIEDVLTNWIPDGFVQLKQYPTYCINKDGRVYNKRNKRDVPIHYRADGVTPYVVINSKRLNIQKLLEENKML